MGRVYLCRDARLGVDVAVKVLPNHLAAHPRAIAQVEREARAIARLRDRAGILTLYDFDRYGETWFLVMEHASGGSLHGLCRARGGGLPEADVRRLGAEVADALAVAHDNGIVHRDLKPSNVLLDGAGRVRVADFGLAVDLDDAAAAAGRARAAGTPLYAAPEALRGRPVDGRSDIYSLGCTLFRMATGQRPFMGEPAEVLALKRSPALAPVDPRTRDPRLSAAFASVVVRLTQPDPAARYEDARDVASALRDAGDGGARPRLATTSPGGRRRAGPGRARDPSRRAAIAILLLACAALAAGVPVLLQARRGGMPPDGNPREESGARDGLGRPVDVAPEPATPPPPPAVLTAQRGLARLPAGVRRTRAGRIVAVVDGSELVLVAGGHATRGGPATAEGSPPAIQVRLSPFLIDRREVTVGAYARFCARTGRLPPEQPAGSTPEHPVVNVTWSDATAYARHVGRRLPTEAEWERAARGHGALPWPWGESDDMSRRNGAGPGDGYVGAAPAGSYPSGESPVGCLDMSGNVAEWCLDWWDPGYDAVAEESDPRGPRTGTLRVVRGGSFRSPPDELPPHARSAAPPDARNASTGFRTAMSME